MPAELSKIEIHTIADLHVSDPHSNPDIIAERINKIAETENAYAIINGDIVNWSSKTSIGDVYGDTMSPMEQIDYFAKLFKPIAGKILSITPGNHEWRAYRQEGIDITRLVARELGIEDRYSETSALLFIRLGKNDSKNHSRKILYTIYVLHGSGGGRKEGAKAIRLADMASIVDSDICIHSHTHLPMIIREAFYRTDTANSTVSKVDKLFINTGAALEYGGYGEAQEFKPASTETPVIYLSGTSKQMTAQL